MKDLRTLARVFPLVERSHLTCPSLEQRVREVADIAHSTAGAPEPTDGASRALNLAALIASDSGLPDLAHRWCLAHIHAYRRDRPLTTGEAGSVLEVALNLARLRMRARDGDTAWHLIQTLHQALATNTDAVLPDATVPLSNLTGTSTQHHALRRWIWMVLLSEGTRALLLHDRWTQALRVVEDHNGIGGHLLEGRQISVVTHCLTGAPDTATAVLEQSTTTTPWERHTAAALDVLCRHAAGRPTTRATTAVIERFLDTERTTFHVPWGLAIAELGAYTDHPHTHTVLDHLAAHATTTADGYTARRVLGACARTHIHLGLAASLATIVQASGLGAGTIPVPLHTTLTAAVGVAQTVLSTDATLD